MNLKRAIRFKHYYRLSEYNYLHFPMLSFSVGGGMVMFIVIGIGIQITFKRTLTGFRI